MRRGAVAVVATILVGGCGGSDGPSKSDYYRSINAFCGTVADAAEQVTKDTRTVQRDRRARRAQVVVAVGASLRQFAGAIDTALGALERTPVPAELTTYQDDTSTGFRRFAATLRATAQDAEKDGVDALERLGPNLSKVPLPATPPDISANAKACARLAPVG